MVENPWVLIVEKDQGRVLQMLVHRRVNPCKSTSKLIGCFTFSDMFQHLLDDLHRQIRIDLIVFLRIKIRVDDPMS